MGNIGGCAALATTLLLMSGCGGDDDAGGATDGGPFGDGGVDISIEPPRIPWLAEGRPPVELPVLTPCPDGWEEVVDEDGITLCEPWPGGGATDCPMGQARFPGDSACVTIGEPCPAGDYSEVLPTDRPVIYVHGSADPGGDGTRDRPFYGFSDPDYLRPPGGAIAMAKGRFQAATSIPDGAIYGACVDETSLVFDGAMPEMYTLLLLRGTGEVHDLRLGPSNQYGPNVRGPDTSMLFDGVEIIGVRSFGLGAGNDEAGEAPVSIEAHELVIRDVVPGTGAGVGLALEIGASATLRRVAVERAVGIGIASLGYGQPTNLVLEQTVVRDTRVDAEGVRATGLMIFGDMAVTVNASVFEGNEHGAIYIAPTNDPPIEIDQVVARNHVHPSSLNPLFLGGGTGLSIRSGITQVRRSVFADSDGTYPVHAAVAASDGSESTLSDIVLTGNTYGLWARGGASLDVTRLASRRNRGTDVDVGSRAVGYAEDVFGARVVLEDALLGDTRYDRSASVVPTDYQFFFGGDVVHPMNAEGIVVRRGATFEGRRLVLERTAEVGVVVLDESTIVLEDTAILEPQSGLLGTGLLLHGIRPLSNATLSRVLVSGAGDRGMTTAFTRATVSDVVVEDMRGGLDFGQWGWGWEINGAEVVAERVEIVMPRQLGVVTWGDEAAVEITDITISDLQPQACVPSDCEGGADVALGVFDGARVAVERFALHGSTGCGVRLTSRAELDLAAGEVAGHQIGFCLPDDGYDIARLSTGVSAFDNGTGVEQTTLPVPTPSPPPETGGL